MAPTSTFECPRLSPDPARSERATYGLGIRVSLRSRAVVEAARAGMAPGYAEHDSSPADAVAAQNWDRWPCRGHGVWEVSGDR
jgi:hypothetical protein